MKRSERKPKPVKAQNIPPQPQPTEKQEPSEGLVPLPTHVEPSPSANQEPACTERVKKHWWKRWNNWKQAIELIALGVGVYAVHVYKGQWDAAINANNINANNFRASQRAWVGLQYDSKVSLAQPEHAMEWNFSWKNFGNSPAFRFRHHARSLVIVPNEASWDEVRRVLHSLNTKDSRSSDGVVFNGDYISDAAEGDRFISTWHYDAIKAHTEAIVIVVTITYTDIFHDEHVGYFCRIYNAPPTMGTAGVTVCPIADEAN